MRRRAVLLVVVVMTAALATSVLVLAATVEPAEAAFPGKNGKIAYTIWDRDEYDIGAVNSDGTGATELTSSERDTDSGPAWSPDGEKIVFTSNRDSPDPKAPGGDYELYTMNADGSDQRRLTETPTERETGATWSPDGTKIAFNVSVKDTDHRGGYLYDLYVMNADGTGRTRLTTNPGMDWFPAWSPDGTKIAFHSCRDYWCGIHTMAPAPEGDENRPQPLAGGYFGHSPDWSPNGERIAFWVGGQSSTATYIAVMNADGTGRTRLSKNNNYVADRYPTWSPNGKKIAFNRKDKLVVMDAVPETGKNQPRRVIGPAGEGVEVLLPDWQPIPR